MTTAETRHTIERITEADLEWWLELIPTLDWVFAVTYAEGARHEYVVGGRTPGLTVEDCTRAARVIRTFGEPAKFFKDTRIYLVDDRGWKYWDMAGDDPAESGLINRARAEHVYGVQNAPRTRAENRSPYDGLATYWDASEHSARPNESGAIKELVKKVSGGHTKCRVLDIGCGTGLALDLGITESARYVGIDPSQAMLNQLVRKHPFLAAAHPMTFAEAIKLRVLGGTRFDLVLALGGSASYLSTADFAAIPVHAKGPILLSVYAENEGPVAEDLTEVELDSARSSLRAFAAEHGGFTERVGRFDVAVVGQR